ncbi:Ferrichrome outer membrane transporter/phage receptor [Oligella sp. MSHR50489EDL]|uniref:TonB-dependent receptor n=1 Tax=Oligella sp. MSHR50489EDL TaxID=3139409 RepID=UPI003D81AF63
MKYKKISSLMLCVFAYPSISVAQDAAINDGVETFQLEAVTVYSRGIKESRLGAPFSVDVIDSTTIERRGMKNVLESLSSVSSVNIHDGVNASHTNVWIRGVGSITNAGMDDGSVGLIIDGVSNGKRGFTRPLLDVERVEVAKGPQGTIFGSRAEAGSVIIKTVDPQKEFEGRVGFRVGNKDLRGVNGMLNIPLSDQWSFRIAAQVERFDDYVKDTDTGKPLDERTNDAVQAKLRWNDGNRHDAILSVYWDQRKNYMPVALPDPLSLKTRTLDLPRNTNRRNWGISLRYTYDFDFGQFASTTSYHRHKSHIHRISRLPDWNDFFNTIGGVPLALRPIINEHYTRPENNFGIYDEKVNQFSQELKLSGETEKGLKWLVGAHFEKRDRDYGTDSMVGMLRFTGPNARYSQGTNTRNSRTDREFDYQSEAIFGEFTLPLTDALSFIAGGRWAHESLDYKATWQANPDLSLPLMQYTQDSKVSDTFFSGRLGVSFELTPEWRIYALQSWGNKFGGFADGSSNLARGENDSPYGTARISTQEVGTKYLSSDGRLAVDFALFNNEVKDDHVSVVLFPSFLSDVANVDTRSRGAEISVAGWITDNFNIRGDLTYLSTEVTNVPATSAARRQNFTKEGNRLTQAARFSGGVAVGYNSDKMSLGFLGEGQVHADVAVRHVGTRYAWPDNLHKLPSHTLVDASIGLTSKHHDILLWGKNLTNKKYYAYGGIPNDGGYPAQDRTFGLNYSFKF